MKQSEIARLWKQYKELAEEYDECDSMLDELASRMIELEGQLYTECSRKDAEATLRFFKKKKDLFWIHTIESWLEAEPERERIRKKVGFVPKVRDRH